MNIDNKSKSYITFGVIAIIVCIAIFGGISASRNIGKSSKTISKENGMRKLNKYVNSIDPEDVEPIQGIVNYEENDTAFQELPNLTDDSIVVQNTTSTFAEIFSSSEKTGTGTDGYLRTMAKQFNESNPKLKSGEKTSIKLRTVSSGQQVDYIASQKYIPDAISPSSSLSIEMLNFREIETETISDSLVKNYAGVVLSKKAYSTLVEDYGGVSVQTVAKATSEGAITTGYTNPFTSATGLNFLITLLDSYDPDNILSEKATNSFIEFQKKIPFVALTTGQMRNAANKGTLDAFVLEYQAFINDNTLTKYYKFIPFGYEHENPLVALSSASPESKETLQLFAEYCKNNGSKLAKECGFNQKIDAYTPPSTNYAGGTLIDAQKLYKENKDSDPVICVFVADISGSMAGEPINALKDSLINSMQYINTDNYIGLITYNDDVQKRLPINKFDLNQQSLFVGTVENLSAAGGTATFDGLCVAMKMIEEKKEEIPNAKTMIFVLSDGECNRGHSLKEVSPIVSSLKTPIYTIGYNANIDALKQLSDINEGVCIDAKTDDVVYQLKQLFNANM